MVDDEAAAAPIVVDQVENPQKKRKLTEDDQDTLEENTVEIVSSTTDQSMQAERVAKSMNDNDVGQDDDDESDVEFVGETSVLSNQDDELSESETEVAETMAQAISDLDGLPSARKNELFCCAVNHLGDELMGDHVDFRDDLILRACRLDIAFAHHINRIAELNQKGTSSSPLELDEDDGEEKDEAEEEKEEKAAE